MHLVEHRAPVAATAKAHLVLNFEARCKSRLRTRLLSGEEVGLFMERGTVLRGGDKLAHGLDVCGIDVTGEMVCDLGSSTGGPKALRIRRGDLDAWLWAEYRQPSGLYESSAHSAPSSHG